MALQWKCLLQIWIKLNPPRLLLWPISRQFFFVLKSVCLRVSNMIIVGLAYSSKRKLCKNTVGLWCRTGAAGCRDALCVNRHMHARRSSSVWPRTRAAHAVCVNQALERENKRQKLSLFGACAILDTGHLGWVISYCLWYTMEKIPMMRICHFAIVTISLLLLSSNALSQHTVHSPAHPENSPHTCMFCTSSRGKIGQGETADSRKCCCCSLRVYLSFVKLSSLMHCFLSAIHFTAAVQGNFSIVGLIKDDLILSYKGRELTLQHS